MENLTNETIKFQRAVVEMISNKYIHYKHLPERSQSWGTMDLSTNENPAAVSSANER